MEQRQKVDRLTSEIYRLSKNRIASTLAIISAKEDLDEAYILDHKDIVKGKKSNWPISPRNLLSVLIGVVTIGIAAYNSDLFKTRKNPEQTEQTDINKNPEWPEGYKPSALQLELQKMLPAFPPKEITDPKLTEEQREEKYEEAIFKVFKDSKVPATEEMTQRLLREARKLLEVSSTKKDSFGTIEHADMTTLKRDFGSYGLEVSFERYTKTNLMSSQRLTVKVNHLVLSTSFLPNTDNPDTPWVDIDKRKINKEGKYEIDTDGYMVTIKNDGTATFSKTSNFVRRFLGNEMKEMETLYAHYLHSEKGKNTKLKTNILNTTLALILLANDTFDLEFEERNLRENKKRIDKISSLMEYFRERGSKDVPETRAENKFTKTTPAGTVLFYGRQGTTSNFYDLDSINLRDKNGEFFVNHEVGKGGHKDGDLLFVNSDKKGAQYSFEFGPEGKLTGLRVREDFTHILSNLGIDKENGPIDVSGVHKYFIFNKIAGNAKVQNMFKAEIDEFIRKLNDM